LQNTKAATWIIAVQMARSNPSIEKGDEEAHQRASLTPEQVATRWACNPNTIRKMIRDGSLKAFRVGKKAFACGQLS
jgi:excisionase family DNA binding protein